MTEPKQPWPKPDPLAMTTKERGEMMKIINSLAHGIGLKNKLEIVYKAGFKAGQESEKGKSPAMEAGAKQT